MQSVSAQALAPQGEEQGKVAEVEQQTHLSHAMNALTLLLYAVLWLSITDTQVLLDVGRTLFGTWGV